MLLGRASSVLAEAVSSPYAYPNPPYRYYAQAADTDSIEGWPTGPQIEAQSAVLMDLNSEAILYSKNADTQLYPASITKLLTCLLGCENLDKQAARLLFILCRQLMELRQEALPFMVMRERFSPWSRLLWG